LPSIEVDSDSGAVSLSIENIPSEIRRPAKNVALSVIAMLRKMHARWRSGLDAGVSRGFSAFAPQATSSPSSPCFLATSLCEARYFF